MLFLFGCTYRADRFLTDVGGGEVSGEAVFGVDVLLGSIGEFERPFQAMTLREGRGEREGRWRREERERGRMEGCRDKLVCKILRRWRKIFDVGRRLGLLGFDTPAGPPEGGREERDGGRRGRKERREKERITTFTHTSICPSPLSVPLPLFLSLSSSSSPALSLTSFCPGRYT